jgi:hypothetical protein
MLCVIYRLFVIVCCFSGTSLGLRLVKVGFFFNYTVKYVRYKGFSTRFK